MIKIDYEVQYGFGIKLTKEECNKLFPSLKYKDIEEKWHINPAINLPEIVQITCIEDCINKKKKYYLQACLDFSEGYEEENLIDNTKTMKEFAAWCKSNNLRNPNFWGDIDIWADDE